MARVDVPAFDQVSSEFQPVPEGQYAVTIEATDLTTTKDSKQPLMKVTYNIAEGEFAGRKIFDNLTFGQMALWRVKKLCEASGAPYDSGGFNTEDLVGRPLQIIVMQEVYEGKPQNKVRDYVK